MLVNRNGVISRRGFLKLSGAATAAAALGGPRILHALVPSSNSGSVDQVQEKYSACDMCFNKCGLIAKVEGGVVKKLDLQNRAVNYLGNMNWVKGKIVRKYEENGEHLVDLDLFAECEDGRIHTKGMGTVRLLSRGS